MYQSPVAKDAEDAKDAKDAEDAKDVEDVEAPINRPKKLKNELKKEFIYPLPSSFTTTKEFYERLHLAHSQAYRFVLRHNVDWYDTDFGPFVPTGSIYLLGSWCDDDIEWEHGWSVEIRKSKKNYRILLRATIYHDRLHPMFWKQMTEEVIPLLNEFIQKV